MTADRLAALIAALTDEDEIAHGEAVHPDTGRGLGACAYCDDRWPCRTQRGIDRALAAAGVTVAPQPAEERGAWPANQLRLAAILADILPTIPANAGPVSKAALIAHGLDWAGVVAQPAPDALSAAAQSPDPARGVEAESGRPALPTREAQGGDVTPPGATDSASPGGVDYRPCECYCDCPRCAQPDGLDVERLSRALRHIAFGGGSDAIDEGTEIDVGFLSYSGESSVIDLAAAIAREYGAVQPAPDALRAAYRDDPVGTFNVIVAVLNEHGWDARPVAPDTLRAAAQAALVCLVGQHRSVVSEWSANFGGHVAIRDGWVEYDDDTTVEECPVCEAVAALRAALGDER